jgi:hypothetical protein
MDIRQLSKKLRHAADVLDALFEVKGTPTIAKRIIKNLPKARGGAREYPKGTHWTQRPENKARLKKQLKRMAAMRHGDTR